MLEQMIKINDKVFVINQKNSKKNWTLTCPNGHTCFANFLTEVKGYILHKDMAGKIQSEPFILI